MISRIFKTWVCLLVMSAGASGLCPPKGFGPQAGQKTIGGIGKFWFDVDFARFYGNDTLTYVEVYYSVAEQKLTYREANERFVGGMNLSAVVMNEGKVVDGKEWTVPHSVKDTAVFTRGQNIIGLTAFGLRRGEYLCKVSAYDFYDPVRADTADFPLHIAGYSSSVISLSDLELCTSIRQVQSDSGNIFYKNTLEALPNVTAVYGHGVPILFYYLEAYNLLSFQTESYVVRVQVYDSGGREAIRHERTKKRSNNSSVEVGTLNVHQLRGGTYTLAVSLFDTTKSTGLSSSKKFFVYKPTAEVEKSTGRVSGEVAGSEFAVMQEEELNRDFAQARYIATDAETQQYKGFASLDSGNVRLEAKRSFLYDFWQKRNPYPSGVGNEFRQEYLKRIGYANEQLRGVFKEGWQTERGRVYITHGNPDEIERHPSSVGNIPYEIWRYNQIQGGVMFVFVDRTGFGDWILVHSDHRNEIRDDGWARFLKK